MFDQKEAVLLLSSIFLELTERSEYRSILTNVDVVFGIGKNDTKIVGCQSRLN